MPDGLLIHAATGDTPPQLAVRIAIVCAAGLIAALAVAGAIDSTDRSALLGITLASVVTRIVVPDAFLQSDADDLRILAIARGLDLSGLGGTARPTPELLAILSAFRPLFGSGSDIVLLPARVAGTMLPIVGFAVARRWLGDLRHAQIAAMVLVLAPSAIAFSATPTAEMPASALYAVALLSGLIAIESRHRLAPLAIIFSAIALSLSCALKDELLALAPALAIALGARAWRRDRRSLVLASIPAIAAVAYHAWSPLRTIALASWRAHVLSLGHLATYLLAIALFNAPFLPAKLALAKSLRTRELWPLHAHVLLFLGIFATAFQVVGANQWRYAISWSLPFAICIAPTIAAAWESARRRTIVLIAAEMALGTIGYALFATGGRNADLAALRAWERPAPALVVHAAYRQDRDAGLAAVLDGRAASVSLENLWPPTCAPSVEQRRVAVMSEYRDIVVKTRLDDDRFIDVDRLDEDVAWLAQREVDRALMFSPDRYDVGVARDDVACADAVPQRRASLARYRSIGLLVDSEHARDRRMEWLRAHSPIAIPRGEDRTAFLERASRWLVLDEPIGDRVLVVQIASIPDPLDPDGPPLWARAD